MKNHLLTGALLLGGLGMVACGSENPVQPSTPGEGLSDRPATPELAVTTNSWLIKAKMPVNRTNMAVATVTNAAGQSVVYVIGGLTTTGMPSETSTCDTVPARGAGNGFITFMASMISSVSPLATFEPTLTNGAAPGSGAR